MLKSMAFWRQHFFIFPFLVLLECQMSVKTSNYKPFVLLSDRHRPYVLTKNASGIFDNHVRGTVHNKVLLLSSIWNQTWSSKRRQQTVFSISVCFMRFSMYTRELDVRTSEIKTLAYQGSFGVFMLLGTRCLVFMFVINGLIRT